MTPWETSTHDKYRREIVCIFQSQCLNMSSAGSTLCGEKVPAKTVVVNSVAKRRQETSDIFDGVALDFVRYSISRSELSLSERDSP
jgi:hypothetical protein